MSVAKDNTFQITVREEADRPGLFRVDWADTL
jgi:hypothetical protein